MNAALSKLYAEGVAVQPVPCMYVCVRLCLYVCLRVELVKKKIRVEGLGIFKKNSFWEKLSWEN